eukprot:1196001-Prorocentrum_minimum.AAC.2
MPPLRHFWGSSEPQKLAYYCRLRRGDYCRLHRGASCSLLPAGAPCSLRAQPAGALCSLGGSPCWGSWGKC